MPQRNEINRNSRSQVIVKCGRRMPGHFRQRFLKKMSKFDDKIMDSANNIMVFGARSIVPGSKSQFLNKNLRFCKQNPVFSS
jgi:hypothetical protein